MSDRPDGVTITYDDKKLIASGSFITFGQGSTTLEVNYSGDRVCLELEFIDSEEDTEQKLKVSLLDEKTAKYRFYNYKNTLGTVVFPVEIGTIGRHRLWFSYKIYGFEKHWVKHVFYFFYVGPEANDG